MNRTIKFRAWEEETKTMHEDVGVYRNRITCRLDESLLLGRHDYPLMQFTGLSDKNGKEIYEGDIVVRHPDWKYGQEVVRWEDTGFTITSNAADYEIIGNIYQNPELLAPTSKGGN